MIKVEQLSKNFCGTPAVNQISFEVNEHENLALLGTSGCGKTTTLKMLNRLIEPTSGKIYIGGKNILDERPETLRRGIGYVLQNTGLFPHYTIAENMAIVPQLLKWDSSRVQNRINELLEKLHLQPDVLQKYPNQLSGGQQQRVGLARALMANPPVLLMDEPFGALDNVTRAKIQAEFLALDELTQKTIIMVTHDVQEAFELADRICLMDKGEIVQTGTPAQLLFNPANTFVKEFFDGQRLALEFKAIKLKDLWHLLPEAAFSAGDSISADADVWAGMESFRASNTAQLNISYPQNGQTKTVNFQQLMAAFYQFQNDRAHE